MFDRVFFKTYVQQKLGDSFQLSIKYPRKYELEILESSENLVLAAPESVPSKKINQWCIEKNVKNNYWKIWFKYPEGFYLCLQTDHIVFDVNIFKTLYHLLFPCFYEKFYHQNKSQLENIIFNTCELTSLFSLDALLNKILTNVLSVIPVATGGILWVYDSNINKFICRAYAGDIQDKAADLIVNFGNSVIGKAFSSGKPNLYRSWEEMRTGFLPENEHLFEGITKTRPKSMIAMPIKVNNHVECVMVVYQNAGDILLSFNDMNLLKVFSDQISVAINNAKLFTLIQDQLGMFQKINEIYHKLTLLSLSSSSFNEKIIRLRQLIGFPFLFVDFSDDRLYPNNLRGDSQINPSELFQYVKNLKVYNQLVKYEDKPEYYLYPVCSNEILLGCLAVMQKPPFSSFDEMLIEICSKIIALEQIKRSSLTELSNRKNYQIFNELISSSDPITISEKCQELLLDMNKNYICIIFSFLSEPNVVMDETILFRLVSKLKEELGDAYQNVFCNKQEVILLAVLKTSKQTSVLRRKIELIVSQTMQREKLRLGAGIGGLYLRAEAIAQSYREARKALSYQIINGNSGVMEYSAIGIDQLFINLPHEDIVSFIKSIFFPLRQSAKNMDYYLENTLITYINANCSPNQAASELHIHVNTLHQRLKNIEKILNLSLHSADDLLKIQIACHLKNIYPEINEY